MFPQTHRIISQHVHHHVSELLGVNLNKSSLTYGSIKPDIAPHLAKLAHFKPNTFDYICDEINELSKFSLVPNVQFMKLVSTNIGVVTHFIADYFCVPHNDRATYKNNFLQHMKYENNLHKLFKSFDKKIDLTDTAHIFYTNNNISIKDYLETLHLEYTNRGESLENDLESSVLASSSVALFIITQAIAKLNLKNAA
ncbi:zinc dependent phospholipase C family protein [Serpentinicella alkaliphila]|uniref:Zinc dependent phospholipase C n=1 Tax=Serpentinicella alkaliphila TaxID=1734049 RepID=A0A4R2T745_9FIRM|nr:zinc dependent phospholipase C family protein [Serpentinicella alkaliphila]QUH24392.1 zinc dependent phospholipase C family protein [Serpentinicella alkaliphila]TCP98350.1 zinc dependent phospholipase C [Serpentinicella alkaliphila]